MVFYNNVVTPSGWDSSLRLENIKSAQNGDQALREREIGTAGDVGTLRYMTIVASVVWSCIADIVAI